MQNKDKPKKGHLPEDMMSEGRYLAASTVSDVWICYPWEATYDHAFSMPISMAHANNSTSAVTSTSMMGWHKSRWSIVMNRYSLAMKTAIMKNQSVFRSFGKDCMLFSEAHEPLPEPCGFVE